MSLIKAVPSVSPSLLPTSPRAHAVEFLQAPECERQIDVLIALIDAHQRFAVIAHARPDGDAVGATLALALMLEQQGKQVVIMNRDPLPEAFAFLPAAGRWAREWPEAQAPPEVTLVLDCADRARLGEGLPAALFSGKTVVIDHHDRYEAGFADLYVRDTGAAATGEVLFRLLARAGWELDRDIAQCLYCSVMTDTGGFRYASTTRASFQIAAELLEAGVDAWEMTSHLYESQPRERVELLAASLSTLKVACQGRLATLRVELKMCQSALNRLPDEAELEQLTDGFINHARAIRGVEVAAELRQLDAPEQGEPTWLVSLRSRGEVNVGDLAALCQGHGKRYAAQCTLQGSAEEVELYLAQALERLLDPA